MEAAILRCPGCGAPASTDLHACAHCGARLATAACPSCFGMVFRGTRHCPHCGACGGVWMDNPAFEALCAERDRQAGVLTFRAPASVPAPAETQIRYRSCPECGTLMNRLNFQRVSGVIVDVCREHGTWFDADELRRIVEFIQGGGLERGRGGKMSEEDHLLLRETMLEIRRQPEAPPAAPPLTVERIFQSIAKLFR